MPFIPVETMARAGGQPFGSLANTRATYANGDFAGLSAVTTFAPNLKTNVAYVVVEDQLAGGNRAIATTRTSRGEDYAFILSPEFSPFKGLDIKPLYSYFHADGLTAGTSRHSVINRRFVGGGTAANCSATNSAAANGGGASAGDSTNQEDRHTVGLDIRWRSGPFGFDPIIHYQWGQADHQAVRTNGQVGRVEADVSSYIVDLIASRPVRWSSRRAPSIARATRPGTTSPSRSGIISRSPRTEAITPDGPRSWPMETSTISTARY